MIWVRNKIALQLYINLFKSQHILLLFFNNYNMIVIIDTLMPKFQRIYILIFKLFLILEVGCYVCFQEKESNHSSVSQKD